MNERDKLTLTIKHKNGNEMVVYYKNDKALYKTIRRLDKKLSKIESITAVYSTGRIVTLTQQKSRNINIAKILFFLLTPTILIAIILKYFLKGVP